MPSWELWGMGQSALRSYLSWIGLEVMETPSLSFMVLRSSLGGSKQPLAGTTNWVFWCWLVIILSMISHNLKSQKAVMTSLGSLDETLNIALFFLLITVEASSVLKSLQCSFWNFLNCSKSFGFICSHLEVSCKCCLNLDHMLPLGKPCKLCSWVWKMN